MYIAFKWLIVLAVVLWLALCSFDIYMKECKKNITLDTSVKPYGVFVKYKNGSIPNERKFKTREQADWKYTKQNYRQPSIAFLHYVTFLAGAFAVSIFHKKTEIMKYTQNRITKTNTLKVIKWVKETFGAINLKETAMCASVATLEYFKTLWGAARNFTVILITFNRPGDAQNINSTLLQRVKEIGQDRKALGQLLLAAINENKNIRLRFQSETTAKNRLMQYIEDTQKLIKENRTRYVNFQQLYSVTHKENVFLRSRIKKLVSEKDDAEKNLMTLINEVYRSQNNNLKAYCTRFMVHTKKNLLNKDVNAEIRKFLQRSKEPQGSTGIDDQLGIMLSGASSLPKCSLLRVTDTSRDAVNLVRLVSDAPKLRGLPGECVWTVKDKNGVIEKLYEYNYETDYDNGDTIRRIREYSVYHDKDWLLDQTTILPKLPDCPSLSASAVRLRLDVKPLTNLGFMTRSKEFKTFLRNSPGCIPSRTPSAPLPCG